MSQEFKLQQVKRHNNQHSLWIVIHDEVYDVTKFIDEHPGGADSLLDFAGEDGTEAFENVGHSSDARELLKTYKIGTICLEERKLESCCIPNVKKKKKSAPITQYNRDCFVYALDNSCCDNLKNKAEKTWRTYDGSPDRSPSPKSPRLREPVSPTVERRVDTIIVPRERSTYRRRSVPPSPPPSGSKLKWALIALAGALVIGLVMRKYMT